MSGKAAIASNSALAGGLALALVAAGGAAPAHGATERVIYSFTAPTPSLGGGPQAGLTSIGGKLYGTTAGAPGAGLGDAALGTVFELTPPAVAGGAWTESTLHTFSAADGIAPDTSLLNGGLLTGRRALYGTTRTGGDFNCVYPTSCGTVFELKAPRTPGGSWTASVPHTFTGAADGFAPEGDLIQGGARLIHGGGTLYGTTVGGGAFTTGYGTVFALTPPAIAGRAWTKTVLHAFTGPPDGSLPVSGLLELGGTLIGTTAGGGANDTGTVFMLSPPSIAGGAWSLTVLYSFGPTPDRTWMPTGRLIAVGGTLFGTTYHGGPADCGGVFALSPPAVAGGAWSETTLHAFQGSNGPGADGCHPAAGLIDIDGTLYGTTYYGGVGATGGTVFALTPPAMAGGAWTETVPHVFGGNGDGAQPFAGLIRVGRSLYGTTEFGGSGGQTSGCACGTVFEITP